MTLEPWMSEEERAPWKVVRKDDFSDVMPGCLIVYADEISGTCGFLVTVRSDPKTLHLNFPAGIRLVRRNRQEKLKWK